MRQILVDYSRHHRAAKRGADCTVVLEEALVLPKSRSALTVLARIDEQQSRIVELRFFGGLTTEETAQVLGISAATVKRDWSVVKAWLSRQMKRG
jgi:RNA polymerase sigma factor (TIGR02999 family)